MRNQKETDRKHIQRSIELASKGFGFVSPNPMVGCVVVRKQEVIAEGFHQYFGGPHAEVVALRKAGWRAKGATLYVNMEPCSHQGKTPPCADAIIKAGIKRVVISTLDPNPLVSGRGAKILRRAGIEVLVGVLRKESERLNERFFMFMKTGLPFVALKIARTLDGRVAGRSGKSKWITPGASRREGHRLRSMYDAVVVGAKTVESDNPKLTVRMVKGRNPLRVVLDPGLRTKPGSAVFDTKQAGTLVFTTAFAMSRNKAVVARLSKRGVYILGLDKGKPFDLSVILRSLAALGVSSVLVEGGSYTSGEFLRQNRVDKVHAFVASRLIGNGISGLLANPTLKLGAAIPLRKATCRQLGPDFLIEGFIER
jgi:diaminohydroxyphosphoribosylaminopyrimidine deaminase / 5-amino-6-(5-phosphoribosylamino)uracil reductase